jgi:acyl dehydratase
MKRRPSPRRSAERSGKRLDDLSAEARITEIALCLNGLWVGMTWEGRPVTITDEAIIAYGQELDPQPFHVDAQAAVSRPFGGLIASGWQVAALAMRELVAARPFGASPILGLGVDELRWLKPVRPGGYYCLR